MSKFISTSLSITITVYPANFLFAFPFQTIFFLWFALSGWLFRSLLLATWVLPIAAPLLLGAVANNLVVKVMAKCVFFDFVMVISDGHVFPLQVVIQLHSECKISFLVELTLQVGQTLV